MSVREADPAWKAYDTDRKRVGDMFKGRDTALAHIRGMPGHDTKTKALFDGGAYFLPVVSRTLEAFGGLVFGKAPKHEVPAGLETYLEDVNGSGQSVDRLAEQGFDGIGLTGNIALLVEVPPAAEGQTKAKAEANGIRPSLQLYTGVTILAARYETFGAIRKLSHVRLLEKVQEPDPTDEFKLLEVEQVRVLDLDADGFYRQRVFRDGIGAGWGQVGEAIYPTEAGKRLDEIPCYFSNPRDGEARPARPVLADLAEISIAHLNNSAALEWALLWTANPTPVFIGLPKGTDEVKLGSSEGIALDKDGDAKFLEFTGQGLTSLETALDTKRRDAAMMGARMLLESNKAAETAETARLNKSGETSVVGGIANALSECFTKALARMAKWAGVPGEVKFTLHTDFNPSGMSPQMLSALLAAVVAGKMTEQEFYALLQESDLVDPAQSFEDHVSDLPEEPTAEEILAAAGGAVDPVTGQPKPAAPAPAAKPKAKAPPKA